MRVVIVTDAFPPVAGGSGWSTHALASALRALGHAITIVRPRFAPFEPSSSYDGFDVRQPQFRAPRVPFVRNYFRNERLYDRLGETLADIIRADRVDVVHGQHLLSGPAAIRAARRTGAVSVCTIRDYWPVCYWSDLMLDPATGAVCPGCSAGQMTRCVRPRGGRLWPLGLPAIPYMLANLRGKRRDLAWADALVAVSGHVMADLRLRAPELASARIEVIPNPVDVDQIHEDARLPAPLTGPYVLYVGKLEPNKDSLRAVHAAGLAQLGCPLVVVGDGPLRPAMEAEAHAQRLDVRFTGWLARPAMLAWLRHASMLVFPSAWPEPFSRVLLEAAALGVPIVAMDTGGTSDIVVADVTGALCRDVHGLARAMKRLHADAALRERLGAAAQARVRQLFASGIVAAKMESLYLELLGGRRMSSASRMPGP